MHLSSLLHICAAFLRFYHIFTSPFLITRSGPQLYHKGGKSTPDTLHPHVPRPCHVQCDGHLAAPPTQTHGSLASVVPSAVCYVQPPFLNDYSDFVDHTCPNPSCSLPLSCLVLTEELGAVSPFWANLNDSAFDVMNRSRILCSQRIHFFLVLSARLILTSWSYLIMMDVIPRLTTKTICSLLALLVQRHLMRKHDFRIQLRRAWNMVALMRPSTSFVLLISASLMGIFMNFHLSASLSHDITISTLSDGRDKAVQVGGGHRYLFPPESIMQYVKSCPDADMNPKAFDGFLLAYAAHVDDLTCLAYPKDKFIHANVPLSLLIPHISLKAIRDISKIHSVILDRQTRDDRERIRQAFDNHSCVNCYSFSTVFSIQATKKGINCGQVKSDLCSVVQNVHTNTAKPAFPPPPLSDQLAHHIISDFCDALSPKEFEEAGCAVCGELRPLSKLSRLKQVKQMLHILHAPGVT